MSDGVWFESGQSIRFNQMNRNTMHSIVWYGNNLF